MIIQNNVIVSINANNLKHYESIGYKIPKHQHKRNKNRFQVKKGTKIKVKVSDLPKGSHVKVLCHCDVCGKENLIKYQNIKSNEYICLICLRKSEKNIKNLKQNTLKMKCTKRSKETKEKMKNNHKDFSGKNNPNYNPNLTDKGRKQRRHGWGQNKWKNQIKKHNNFTCQKCGSKENLQAHHINNWKNFKEQRLDIDNGITLCKDCHKKLHSLFGLKTETKDLLNFLKIM